MKLAFIGLKCIVVGVVIAALAGCTSKGTQYKQHGFDPSKRYNLLALKYNESLYSHSSSSFSGAFLFPIGFASGGGSSTTEMRGYVGFIINAGHGRIVMLRVDADVIDYRLDKNAKVPSVRLYLADMKSTSESFDKFESLTQNIEGDINRIDLTLAPSDFSRDIAVLTYVGRQG
jgi:hypothetical protein